MSVISEIELTSAVNSPSRANKPNAVERANGRADSWLQEGTFGRHESPATLRKAAGGRGIP